jgi:prophage regulatory protein
MMPEYIDMKELAVMLKISPETIRRMIKKGEFPKKVYVSTRRVRWPKSEIENWISKRNGARSSPDKDHEQPSNPWHPR